MDAILQFTVTNQEIERTDEFTVVEGSENYLQAHFTFTTPDWDGMIKTGVFINEDGTMYPSLCKDDTCDVPPAWLKEQKGAVGVIGSDGTAKITTYAAKVRIRANGYTGEDIEEETHTYFDQLLEAFANKYLETEAQAKLAQRWAVGLEDKPETLEDNAEYYARQAKNDAAQTQNDRNAVSELSEHVDTVAMQVDADKQAAGQYKEDAAHSAEKAALSESNAKASETAAQAAQEAAESAEAQAGTYAAQTSSDRNAVEQAKSDVDKAKQEVSEKKEYVEQAVGSFELLHQQAVADVNNAGQSQTARVEETANQSVNEINSAGNTQVNNVNSAGQKAIENIGNGIDDTLKVKGKAADAAATGKAVEELKSDIGDLNSEVFGKIIESDVTGEVLTGTIVDARTGAESTKFQYSKCTGFIDVSDNTDYYYTGRIYNYIGIAGYDLDGNFVAPVLSDSNEVFTDYKLTIPDGVSKIRASSYSPSENTRFPLQVVKKEKTSNLVDEVSSLNDEVSSLNKNKENITIVNHIYVATTGSDTLGDGTLSNPFASIYHANESITDATEINQYIIHVADGIYTDLQTRYAGVQTHENYEGIKCKPWVIYEGNVKHPEKVVIQWDGKTGYGDEFNYNNHAVHFCPFHITGSNGWKVGHKEIRGFTFDCKNTRYALHVEMSSYGYGVTWKVSDCIFVWHGVPDCSDISYQIPTIGTGSGHYEKGHLLRCRIVNDSGITDGFRNHDSKWVYGSLLGNLPHIGAEIIIEDCVFNAGDSGDTNITFRNIYEDGLVDGYNRFSIINCTGINRLGYSLSGNATKCDWRANVKCSDITNNVFATEGLLQ